MPIETIRHNLETLKYHWFQIVSSHHTQVVSLQSWLRITKNDLGSLLALTKRNITIKLLYTFVTWKKIQRNIYCLLYAYMSFTLFVLHFYLFGFGAIQWCSGLFSISPFKDNFSEVQQVILSTRDQSQVSFYARKMAYTLYYCFGPALYVLCGFELLSKV